MDSRSRLARLTTEASTFDHLLNNIAELMRNLMGTPICLLWMIDKDANEFLPKAFAGPIGQGSIAQNFRLKNSS